MTFERLYQGFADYTMSAEGPLNLCGLSLGAIIALRYAIERPERVQSLILIGGRDEMPGACCGCKRIVPPFAGALL